MKYAILLAGALIGMGSALPVEGYNGLLLVAPYEPPIMTTLLNDKSARLFASIMQASGLDREDLGDNEVMFLVPRDATCSYAERAYLGSLNAKDAAKSYVLGHAFQGQLAIYKEDMRLLSVNYYPRLGSMEGRVAIDETHPFDMPLLNGSSVLVSVKDAALHIGASSIAVDSFSKSSDGVVYLDKCAML
jgi:hypothetical protein